jgi:hypothetical protein
VEKNVSKVVLTKRGMPRAERPQRQRTQCKT